MDTNITSKDIINPGLQAGDSTLQLFRHQATGNPVYKQYVELLGCDPAKVSAIDQIPFLPIEFFKSHRVVTGPGDEMRVFESSGTTGAATSKHYILNDGLYVASIERGFRMFFGEPSDYCILALLPSYLERQHSSLVFMVEHLIKMSSHPKSGFYLHNLKELAGNLDALEKSGQKAMLIGVSYALMDLAEKFPMPLEHTLMVETGGMKGRREELTREELHEILTQAFHLDRVCSEYGMTELLSQAWSVGNGRFQTPPWMKVIIRDPYNPFCTVPLGKTGGIDIIDLANRYSCSFIQTQDLGRLHSDGSFEVLGRFDQAELRGCNLMI